MLLASLGHWLTTHPAYADWGVAIGTFALALATVVLAGQARSEAKKVAQQAETSAEQARISAEQVRISRAALEAQVQPVLIDVEPGSAPEGAQHLIYYEPGDADGARNVGLADVHVDVLNNGHFICSVPFRNAGAGLAFLKDPLLTHPGRAGDLMGQLTKEVVPPGEQTRAVFGPGIEIPGTENATLVAKVPYTDASQSTTLWTEVALRKVGNAWRVSQVPIGRDGEDDPFVVSAGVPAAV